MISNADLLSKLEFSEKEREAVDRYMNSMIEFLDTLNELDTENVEAMSHILLGESVFREDIIRNFSDRETLLSNAPDRKNGYFRVPKTID